MSKRQDSGYLKKLSRVYKDRIAEWSKLPLVVMGSNSSISDRVTTLCDEAFSLLTDTGDLNAILTIENLFLETIALPCKDFMFLNTDIPIADPDFAGTVEYNYFIVHGYGDGYLIEYPTLFDGMTSFIMVKDDVRFISDGEDITANSNYRSSRIKVFMSTLLITVMAFFKALEETDLHPVQVKGTQHRKVHQKKPWTRSDLVTIQYLNQLPREKSEHKGGTHASPRLHQRRGTKRRLINKRFRNHPRYGKTINIKPCWVGERSSTVNGVTYKVL